LKSKYNVLDAFMHLHASVERETKKLLKCVRADKDGKYSGHFVHYYKEHGIKFEKTVPKTIGVVERMNPTINDRIIYMVSHANC